MINFNKRSINIYIYKDLHTKNLCKIGVFTKKTKKN